MNRPSLFIALLSLAVILCAFTEPAEAQGTEMGSASIFTGEGFLFIHNSPARSFTVELKGKELKPLKGGANPTFSIDGKVVQIVVVGQEQFLTGAAEVDEEKILDLHQKWESDYLGNEMYKVKLTLESEKLTIKERKALYWGFKRPSMGDIFDRDYFLTTMIGKNLFGLSSPIEKGAKLDDYKKLFVDSFSSLKISDKPFDVSKLAQQIKDGTYKHN